MWSKGGEPLVTNWNNLLLLRSEEDRLTLAKTSERQVLAPFSSAETVFPEVHRQLYDNEIQKTYKVPTV